MSEPDIDNQRMEPAEREQWFEKGDKLENPWFESYLTVKGYDVHHGEYEVEGSQGGKYWLVVIEPGYKLLNTNVKPWRYRQGRPVADFDEVTVVE